MDCDAATVHIWAAAIGLPDCIGAEFCAQYGFLPRTLVELDTWGNSTGRRTGGWHCIGSSPPVVPPVVPPVNGVPVVPPTDTTKGIEAFVREHFTTILMVGGGFLAVKLLMKR